MRTHALAGMLLILAGMTHSCTGPAQPESSWSTDIDRYWIGPEYWANSLQDWRIHQGRIECVGGVKPLRTLHLLTRSIGTRTGDLQMSLRTGIITPDRELEGSSWRGFLVGIGSRELDYRANAIIHRSMGENGGLAVVITGTGELAFLDNENNLQALEAKRSGHILSDEDLRDLHLELRVRPVGSEDYELTLEATSPSGGDFLQRIETTVQDSRLSGHLAIVSTGGSDADGSSFWFRDWVLTGSKLDFHEERRYGPILAALHTLSNGVLKMTAQLPPVGESDSQFVRLEIGDETNGKWEEIAREKLVVPGWTAHFRIPDWDDSRDQRYRLVYTLADRHGVPGEHYYTGEIRRDPADKESITVAAFTGNSNSHGTFGDHFSFSENSIWFPHADIVQSVSYHRPDLLVFTGDQVYEGRPTAADRSGDMSSYLDYLYKWYLWCWAYEGLARDVPTVCLPDDHDVYHGNIWGAGGRAARNLPPDNTYPDYYRGFEGHWRQDGGGYLMPAEFVRMVERTQTAHLPDPFDPTPVEQDIGVYYTSMTYGRISFAILEDRKFKSAPAVLLPEAQVVNGFSQASNFSSRRLDVAGAELLGERQLRFLAKWAEDWRGADMKASLSQTLLVNLSSYPKDFKTDAGTPGLRPLPFGVIPPDYEIARDMDSNGWPQSGRNRALVELRRGFAFMIAGDQHLGSIVHHGIEDWEDAGYSFCVPSIANLWPRRWYPPRPGENHREGMPAYTGRYLDGFGNRMTVWAASNPVISGQEPAELHDRAPGYGIVRFHKPNQTITMECWPRSANPADGNQVQYPGWPLTVSLFDNYGRREEAHLPTLSFQGIDDPVVQIVDETDHKIVYTVRVKAASFTPKVFAAGLYTVRVIEPETGRSRELTGVRSEETAGSSQMEITFR